MTFRFHRRLALWNILILLLVILISGLNFPLSLFALTVGILSTLLVSYALKLRVSVPLADLLAAIQKMGDGDLQQRVPVKGDPEVAELLRATNTMARHLG
ncbi:MAG TPA: HAMP domain-containing protein, partial [Terriglobia bacterium]|nr:HAMP domain-containing protein [Terriglobia bacterium]